MSRCAVGLVDGDAGSFRVRDSDGRVRRLDESLDCWLGPCDDANRTVLDRCTGATLDVGCGPGRLVAELASSGTRSLGIDANEVAVQLTRARGGEAVQADVFGLLRGSVTWRTVVLLDGNLGIGGDPDRLFSRCRALLGPGGQVLVEAAAPGYRSGRGLRRLETGDEAGPWFPWATLDVAGVAACADTASLRVRGDVVGGRPMIHRSDGVNPADDTPPADHPAADRHHGSPTP